MPATSASEPCIFRRQHEEAAAEQRVGAGGEHGDDVVFRQLGRRVAVAVAQRMKSTLRALGAADPVRLLLLHALGPAFELIQVVQQLLGVVGDLVVPLGEVALLNLGIASPAATLR